MKTFRLSILFVLLIAVVLSTIVASSTVTDVYAQTQCFPTGKNCIANTRCVTCQQVRKQKQCQDGKEMQCGVNKECWAIAPYWFNCGPCDLCPN